jgi:NodT family efflux transporter outer membrane factor (OMF) lipoprotein
MNATVRIALVTLAAAGLSACVSTPVRAPLEDLRVAGEYGLGNATRNTPSVTVDATALARREPTDEPWWHRSGDTRLEHLVSRVLARNTDLVTAGLALQRAQISAGLARNELIPQPQAGLDSTYGRSLQQGASGARTYDASLGVTYLIDLWGKLRLQRDIATWEAQATAEDLHGTRLALIGAAASLYWQLAFLNQRISVGERTLADLERTYVLARSQYNAGAVSRLDLFEAEQTRQAQRAVQSEFEQRRVEVRNALTVLLDGEPWMDEPTELSGGHDVDVDPGLPAELLSRRPDLRAAELRLQASLANIGVVARSYYPTLTLTAGIAGASSQLRDVVSNPIATLGTGLTLPFLRWNERSLSVQLAGADYEIAANEFRSTLYTAFKEVDDALSARAQLAAQIQSREASLDAATHSTRLYEVRYRAGAVPLRHWLDAKERERMAELALAEARLQQLQVDMQLMQALGNG